MNGEDDPHTVGLLLNFFYGNPGDGDYLGVTDLSGQRPGRPERVTGARVVKQICFQRFLLSQKLFMRLRPPMKDL
jgi:hypothetical protein